MKERENAMAGAKREPWMQEAKRLGKKESFNAQEVLAAATGLMAFGELDAHVFGSDTALTLACKFNDQKLVSDLLAIGANPSAPSRYRQSPLMEVFGGLNPMQRASGTDASKWRACAEALVGAGADIHHQNEIGQQAIHWAAWLGSNLDPLMWLLERGADPSAKQSNGETPLMHAAKVGNLAGLKILMGAGADLFSQCWTGGERGELVDPVGMAKHWSAIQPNSEEVVALLRGAQQAAKEKAVLEAGVARAKPGARSKRV